MVFVVAVFIIASCAGPTKWRNPDIPRQQWTVDQATCEGKANMELEKERTMENMVRPDSGTNNANLYEKNMSIYTDRRRAALISGDCLKKLGYEVIPKK